MDLYSDTRRLLSATRIPKPKIAAETKVSVRWLYMVEKGELKDPGILSITRVHRYLSESGEGRAA